MRSASEYLLAGPQSTTSLLAGCCDCSRRAQGIAPTCSLPGSVASSTSTMSSRSHLSITLPRNFTFHYTDGQLPRTPEPEPTHEAIPEPPAPPRQTYKIKRRKAALSSHPVFPQSSDLPQDIPLPTIETPDDSFDQYTYVPDPTPELTEGYLTPTPSVARLISPPKTPAAQIFSPEIARGFGNEWGEADVGICGESISRPSSSCSDVSDSSISSRGSIGSSFGGSCTSPESDVADSFIFGVPKSANTMIFSPPQGFVEPSTKRLKIRRKAHWTEDMEHHLWITYMRYLQDPTVTPFKMLPGTAPPLGICHRVVREAKRTWRGPRHPCSPRSGRGIYAASPLPVGPPNTTRSFDSGSRTPTGAERRKPHTRWPHSSAATRRRLRELCKHQPTLSAHYHRLIHNRSPSPFPSSPWSSSEPKSCQPSSPFEATNNALAFSTREMNVSLTASTATSMAFGNPLSRLASDAPPTAGDPNDDVFGTPNTRTGAHHKSQSLQIGLGIGNIQQRTWPRTLATPFGTDFQHPHNGSTSPAYTQIGQHAHTAPRKLDSPFRLHAPKPLSRSFKRRALHQLNDDTTPKSPGTEQYLLKELFGAPAETSHRRVRSRGFSFGDVGDGARQLSHLFTPPMSQDQMSGVTPATAVNMQANLLAPPASGPPPRLGSPFVEHSARRPYNTFPRGLASPIIETPRSIEERLGEFGMNATFSHR